MNVTPTGRMWVDEWSEDISKVWRQVMAKMAVARQTPRRFQGGGYAVGDKLRAKFPDDYQWRINATPEGKHGVHVRVFSRAGMLTYEEHIARRGFPQRNLIRRVWMAL